MNKQLTYEQWRQDNWDQAHRERDLTALTDTGLGGHLATLKAAELVLPDVTVLCIGVGTGNWVIDLAKRVREVWCLDCSKLAETSVRSVSKFTTEPGQLPSGHFDLALSLWVAPHMTDHDLQEQLNGVIPSLKLNGILALHYKEPLQENKMVDNRAGASDEWAVARRAGMLRRRKHFENMVRWAGGRVKEIVFEHRSLFHQTIEVSIHVVRGD